MGLDKRDDVIGQVRVIVGRPRRFTAAESEPVEIGHDDDQGLDLPRCDQVVQDVGGVASGRPVDLVPRPAVAQVQGWVGDSPVPV